MVIQTDIFLYRIGILPAIERVGTIVIQNNPDDTSENYAKKKVNYMKKVNLQKLNTV